MLVDVLAARFPVENMHGPVDGEQEIHFTVCLQAVEPGFAIARRLHQPIVFIGDGFHENPIVARTADEILKARVDLGQRVLQGHGFGPVIGFHKCFRCKVLFGFLPGEQEKPFFVDVGIAYLQAPQKGLDDVVHDIADFQGNRGEVFQLGDFIRGNVPRVLRVVGVIVPPLALVKNLVTGNRPAENGREFVGLIA